MATRAGTYFPIRPPGYNPSPAPYWNELLNAQKLVGIGTAGVLSQAPSIIDGSQSLLSNRSAQDVINAHLSEGDARAKGLIIPPEPTVTEEERRKSIMPPNIPAVDQGGYVETFPAEVP